MWHPISQADTILQLTDGTPSGTKTFFGSGIVGWAGTLNNWDINLTVGFDSSTAGPLSLDLTSLNITTDPGTLHILFGETDLEAPTPGGGWDLTFAGLLTGPSGTSVTYDAFLDPANGMLATSALNLIGTVGPFGPGKFSGSAWGMGPVDALGLYSITQELTLVAGPGTSPWRLTAFLGNATLGPSELPPGPSPVPTAAPEPTSLLLLGTGLLAVSRTALKKMKRN
jgi:hypothetical protein